MIATLDEWVYSPDGRFRACFTDLGEGLYGEYDEDDPDDAPRLRIDVQTSDPAAPFTGDYDDNGWFWVTDGSYCTDVNAEVVTGEQMHRLLTSVLAELNGKRGSVKRLLEAASWMRSDSAD